jgi:restriction system protein
VGWVTFQRWNREELSETIARTYPEKPPQTRALYGNMIWSFYHEIQPGDFVVARRGRKELAAVGKVVESASYVPGKNPAITHPSFLGIEWRLEPRDKKFPAVIFPMPTLGELNSDEYRSLVRGVAGGSGVVPTEEPLEDPNAFVLEKYLEEFIVSNFDVIFKGSLRIYGDREEAEGQQYRTEIGPIDILAIETKTNAYVVIELKKGRPSDQVIGQTLRYMGWVKKNLCAEDQSVKGLVICKDHDPKLSYALEMTKNIDVRYYNVSFKLKETPGEPVAHGNN